MEVFVRRALPPRKGPVENILLFFSGVNQDILFRDRLSPRSSRRAGTPPSFSANKSIPPSFSSLAKKKFLPRPRGNGLFSFFFSLLYTTKRSLGSFFSRRSDGLFQHVPPLSPPQVEGDLLLPFCMTSIFLLASDPQEVLPDGTLFLAIPPPTTFNLPSFEDGSLLRALLPSW